MPSNLLTISSKVKIEVSSLPNFTKNTGRLLLLQRKTFMNAYSSSTCHFSLYPAESIVKSKWKFASSETRVISQLAGSLEYFGCITFK